MHKMRWIVCALLMMAGVLCLGGCQKALFPDDEPRTQYERYDRLRGRYRPVEQRNAYGQIEPALRGRLAPYRE